MGREQPLPSACSQKKDAADAGVAAEIPWLRLGKEAAPAAKTPPALLWDSPRCACPRKATLSIAILQMPTSPFASRAAVVAEGLVVAQRGRDQRVLPETSTAPEQCLLPLGTALGTPKCCTDSLHKQTSDKLWKGILTNAHSHCSKTSRLQPLLGTRSVPLLKSKVWIREKYNNVEKTDAQHLSAPDESFPMQSGRCALQMKGEGPGSGNIRRDRGNSTLLLALALCPLSKKSH